MPDLPSARRCLPDKVLRRYSIGYDQDLNIPIYFSATSYCLDSNKCVRLIDTRDTKLRSVVLFTRRDKRVQYNLWCWRVRVQGYERSPVLRLGTEEVASRLSPSKRLAPADVLTSWSCRRLDVFFCRRPDVAFLSSSPSSWRHAPANVLTSCSCRRSDVAFLSSSSSSWRHAPADVLTSCFYRRPEIAFLSLSSSSWRHASPSWRRASRLPPVPAVILDVLSSSSFRRPLDVNSSSSRSPLLSALATHSPFVWRIRADSRYS